MDSVFGCSESPQYSGLAGMSKGEYLNPVLCILILYLLTCASSHVHNSIQYHSFRESKCYFTEKCNHEVLPLIITFFINIIQNYLNFSLLHCSKSWELLLNSVSYVSSSLCIIYKSPWLPTYLAPLWLPVTLKARSDFLLFTAQQRSRGLFPGWGIPPL